MSNNPKSELPISKKLSPLLIYTNLRLNKFKPIINPENIENPFPEENTVAKIYSAINLKNYYSLYQLLDRLPNFQNILNIYTLVVDELLKNEYTMSQLMAISTLLYRLSNIKFATVELPKEFPSHSQTSISNIYKNKQPNHYEYIDKKIQQIVKNLISHYNLDIKNNNKYNRNKEGQLALKLKKILFSFIIDYTRPESSEPLVVQSLFPPREIIANRTRYFDKHPEQMARIIGTN